MPEINKIQKNKKQTKIIKMNTKLGKRPWFFYLIVSLLVLGATLSLGPSMENVEEKPFSEVAQLAKDGKIKEINVVGDSLQIKLNDGTKLKSRRDTQEGLSEGFTNAGVDTSKVSINYGDTARSQTAKEALLTFGP